MKKIQLSTLILGALMVALSGCGDSTASAVPKVSSTYQKKLDAAWDTASQGKSPTISCASVVGTAVGMASSGQGKKSEAIQAYEACYVDAFVHYANVYIAQPDKAALDKRNQPAGCGTLSTHAMIHQVSLGGFASDLGLNTKALADKARAALGQGAAACTSLFADD
ncbi:MAG: hypothetical protein KA735_11215 [Burkholderiaceae bacterium]|nr:hypothetical protein [Burkholderiaceae bacterium]